MKYFPVAICIVLSVVIGCKQSIPYTDVTSSNSPDMPGTTQRSDPAEAWSKNPRGASEEAPAISVDDSLFKRLEALGYADGTREAPQKHGVTVHDSMASFDGYNLYTSGHAPEAILIDMDGNILHRWSHGLWTVWPHLPKPENPQIFWRRVHVFENGDLLAIFGGVGIIKLDKDSNLLWENHNQAHHDLSVTANGDIYLLTRSERLVQELNADEPFVEDFLTILDKSGREKSSVSILKSFQNAPHYEHYWLHEARQGGDAFHTNTVFLLDGRISPRIPAFSKGNILTSMRHLNAIAVIDMKIEQVVWVHKGSYRAQHDPRILQNGNLMLFDNGVDDLRSRILEFDPEKMELVWSYKGTVDNPFYSKLCGTCQRLPNGNTLITETDAGRAFEVTRDNQIVWEYYNPHRVGEKNNRIASLFEMERLPPNFPVHWSKAYLDSLE